MRATIYLIEVSATAADTTAEEALGGLADIGTTAELAVDGCSGSPLDAITALGARLAWARIVHSSIDTMSSATRLRAQLELHAAREPVFAVLVAGGEALPRAVAAGPGLPSMGHAPRCDFARFEASLRFALGDLGAHGESLFSEPASLPTGDEQLLERLRQLYGE